MSSPHDTRTQKQGRAGDGSPPGGDGTPAVEEETAPEGGARTEGHRRTALAITMVTVGCENPRELAAFWQQALGAEYVHEGEEFVALAGDPRLAFRRVEQPATGKNRLHLDLSGTDRTTEVARLVELGAEVVRNHDVEGFTWTVMTDPAGNEFCVADAED